MDAVDLLRSAGGLLLSAGAVVLFARKSGDQAWTDFERLLVVLIPAVTLYLLGLGVVERSGDERARPWQSVLIVASILLGPVALFQLLQWVGLGARHALLNAAVFAVTGTLAGYAAQRSRVRYAVLLAGLSLVVTWLFLWSKILNHPSADTYRWLLVAAAVLLLTVAARLWRTRAVEAGEIVTAGGISAVAAGTLGVIVGSVAGVVRSFSGGLFAAAHHGAHAVSAHGPTSGLQHFGWDVYLLVVSLGLVWVGSHTRVRGTGYIGGIGLLVFIASVSAQVTRIQAGHAPTSHLAGWPLALLILGAAGLLVSLLYRGGLSPGGER